eukprot:CAMPEP_0114524110 /NCGR_PEP_ID=MMETSP0109-20121206/21670_1 /TAXON_ID=29199 /ORGANISM="Chlorarachnion reptans, Strain CCCM449" /LENGTH=71 /DNA_ID=CAMNT_0001705511 /DNA_START=52 /DNA_END=267 /DNA_ORIENTATION=-
MTNVADSTGKAEVEKLQAEIKALTDKTMSAEEASKAIIEYIQTNTSKDPLIPGSGIENPFGKDGGCSCTIS